MNHSVTKRTNTFCKKTNNAEKRHEIFPKLTIKTPERRKSRRSGVCMLKF